MSRKKMKEIVIIGNGSYARMMNRYLKLTEDVKVHAYAVDEQYIEEPEIDGIKVISFQQLRRDFPFEIYDLIMGIGYAQMSQIRKRLYEQCKLWGYHFQNYIHPSAIISPDIKMGEGNNILEGVIMEVGVSIGNTNLFFGGSIVGHESNIGNYNTFSINAKIAGQVTICDNCFLGIASVVRDSVELSNFTLIGAGAYCSKNMEEYSVLVPPKSKILEDKRSTDLL